MAGVEDFDEDYYTCFGFPHSYFTPIRYTFIKLIENYAAPYLDNKQIQNLIPQLVNLEPETFVDWYSSMGGELMMSTKLALLPFGHY